MLLLPPAVEFASSEVLVSRTLEGIFLNLQMQWESSYDSGRPLDSLKKFVAGEMEVVVTPATPQEDGAATVCSRVSMAAMAG